MKTTNVLLITALLCVAPIIPADAQVTFINGTRVRINLSGTDSLSVLRGRTGAVLEQYNTPAWNDLLKFTSGRVSPDTESMLLKEYLTSKLLDPFTNDEYEEAYLEMVTPRVSKEMPIVVHDISPGSPAEQAGLHKGDIVYAIDDLQTADSRLPQIRAATTGQPGTTIRFSIGRQTDGGLTPLSLSVPLVELHPSTLMDVNRANFKKEVANSKIPVFIAWKADWCHFCSEDEPTLTRVQRHFEGRVKFVRIDADDSPGLIEFDESDGKIFPTYVFYEPGHEVHLAVLGSQPEVFLTALLDRVLVDWQRQEQIQRQLDGIRLFFSLVGLVFGLTLGVAGGIFVNNKIIHKRVHNKARPFEWADNNKLKIGVMILCVVSFATACWLYLFSLCGMATFVFGFITGYWAKRTDMAPLKSLC
jgi:thioredoxin 1